MKSPTYPQKSYSCDSGKASYSPPGEDLGGKCLDQVKKVLFIIHLNHSIPLKIILGGCDVGIWPLCQESSPFHLYLCHSIKKPSSRNHFHLLKDQGCVWMSGWQRKVLALPTFSLFCKNPLKPVISCIVEGWLLLFSKKKPKTFSFHMTIFSKYL